MGAAIPVNAASADVKIQVEATTMDNVSVTIPTTLPIIFVEDGTNILPSDWTIENVSSIDNSLILLKLLYCLLIGVL